MGAWGHGYFEDDSSMDFMYDAEGSGTIKEIFIGALDKAIDADYLEYDDAQAVIVASAYIDRQVNGTIFSDAGQEEPLLVDTFPERHAGMDLSDLSGKAVPALQKIISENSELNELWTENEEDYPAWRKGITDLIERLGK